MLLRKSRTMMAVLPESKNTSMEDNASEFALSLAKVRAQKAAVIKDPSPESSDSSKSSAKSSVKPDDPKQSQPLVKNDDPDHVPGITLQQPNSPSRKSLLDGGSVVTKQLLEMNSQHAEDLGHLQDGQRKECSCR